MTNAAFSPGRLLVILIVLVITEINSAFEVGMMYGILATLMREFGESGGRGLADHRVLVGRPHRRAVFPAG
jgi:hypothetical protein